MEAEQAFEFVGQTRRPRRGEWFVNLRGEAEQASRDFVMVRFPILARVPTEVERPAGD